MTYNVEQVLEVVLGAGMKTPVELHQPHHRHAVGRCLRQGGVVEGA